MLEVGWEASTTNRGTRVLETVPVTGRVNQFLRLNPKIVHNVDIHDSHEFQASYLGCRSLLVHAQYHWKTCSDWLSTAKSMYKSNSQRGKPPGYFLSMSPDRGVPYQWIQFPGWSSLWHRIRIAKMTIHCKELVEPCHPIDVSTSPRTQLKKKIESILRSFIRSLRNLKLYALDLRFVTFIPP